jgi:branched-chain amino acid aminotransferase
MSIVSSAGMARLTSSLCTDDTALYSVLGLAFGKTLRATDSESRRSTMNLENHFVVQAGLELSPSSSPVDRDTRARLLEDAGFGRVFTDHMITISYTRETGWQRGRLQPFGSFSMHPATAGLHYGQFIFEGFKAYAHPDGSIKTFRPYANAARFNQSAARLAMPDFPAERFVAAVDALLYQDRAWVPRQGESALYVRPYMMATDPMFGVRPSSTYVFCVIACPAGAYFPTGVKPVSVWISEDYIRAAPGGTGMAKCAGNYAASLIGQKRAEEHGCQQVVWLDAVERRYIEEMGGMNIFFVFRDGERVQLVTPAQSGSILPGITRDSLLIMAKDLGYEVVERRISLDEWRTAVQQNRMTEAFACGTAATITPIGRVESQTGSFSIHGGEMGPVTHRLRERLLDIQFGRAADPYGWMHRVA